MIPTTTNADAGPEQEAAIQLEQDLSDLILNGILAELSTCHSPHRITEPITCPESELRNKHPRDTNIRFEAEGHAYFLKIDCQHEIRFPTSVSSVWARYFKKFDAETVIQKCYNRWCEDPSKRYYESIMKMRRCGIPDQSIQARIKEEWTDAGIIESPRGENA